MPKLNQKAPIRPVKINLRALETLIAAADMVLAAREPCDLEDAKEELGFALREVDSITILTDALIKAKETINAFHGPEGWVEYQQSPEMRQINQAILLGTSQESE